MIITGYCGLALFAKMAFKLEIPDETGSEEETRIIQKFFNKESLGQCVKVLYEHRPSMYDVEVDQFELEVERK